MSNEVRTFAEGTLRWVQASGRANWATASAPVSAMVGFVKVGASFNSARVVNTVMDRGIPNHHKFASETPIEVKFTYLQAVTANFCNPATGSGVSTPQAHFEVRIQDNEVAAASAQYYQFTNGILITRGWTEGEAGDEMAETWRFLDMVGPTASGYLS